MATMLKKRCPFGWGNGESSDVYDAYYLIQGKCSENGCMAWVTCDDDRAPGYCQLIENPPASRTIGDD